MGSHRQISVVVALAAVALIGVWAVYGETVRFGFHYDDYHVVRPWTRAELAGVLSGNWDPTGIESAFYRPMTAWWYALRFELFGLNAQAQRIVTLAGMSLATLLVGLFVFGETGRARPAVVAALLYAVHPVFAYSQVGWLTNQMHLLATLVVLMAMLGWQWARMRGPWAWTPVFGLQVVAFGIKEDTIALTPLLIALTILRKRFLRDVRLPAAPVLVAAVVITASLPALRYIALGRIGGYGVPGWEQGWQNFRRGLDGLVRLAPARRPWQALASAFSTAVFVAGIAIATFRRSGTSVYLFLAGLLIAILFNLPFFLVSKAELLHLVGLGVVIALAGALDGLFDLARKPMLQLALAVVVAPIAFSLVPLTRHIARDFDPCAPTTLRTDAIVTGWAIVPDEIRLWLADKPEACQAGTLRPLTDLETITWAHGREIDERGQTFRWTSDRAVTFVKRRATSLVMAFRNGDATAGSPIMVRIDGPQSNSTSVLTDSEWSYATIALPPTLGSRLRAMHRVDLRVSATFVPKLRDPASPDTRVLGVQLRIVEVK